MADGGGPPGPILELMKSVSAELVEEGKAGKEDGGDADTTSVPDDAAASSAYGGAIPRKQVPQYEEPPTNCDICGAQESTLKRYGTRNACLECWSNTIETDDDGFGTVVIDNGTWTTKAGFAGEEAPRAVFPTMVGTRTTMGETPLEETFVFVGDEAQSRYIAAARDPCNDPASHGDTVLDIRYPLRGGIVTDWDSM